MHQIVGGYTGVVNNDGQFASSSLVGPVYGWQYEYAPQSYPPNTYGYQGPAMGGHEYFGEQTAPGP